MLTFFRKIRRLLLESGSARKFMLYAIGEIALVVIGLLIALQINNLNENIKDRALEDQYYCRLHEDILRDKERIDQLISQMMDHKSDANQLLRIVLNGEFNSQDILI